MIADDEVQAEAPQGAIGDAPNWQAVAADAAGLANAIRSSQIPPTGRPVGPTEHHLRMTATRLLRTLAGPPELSAHPGVAIESWLNKATRGELVDHIMHAGEDARDAAARLREVIRERETALSREEAAFELARQYAQRAGIDVSREDALAYVSDYWERRGRHERDWQLLEGQRWEALRLARDLEDCHGDFEHEDAKVKVSASELALRVAKILGSVCSAQGMTKRKPGDLAFERPTAPGGEQLALVAAGTPTTDETGHGRG